MLQRLRRRTDIQRVFREGRRVQSTGMLLHARRREPDEPVQAGPRMAVAAAKRFRGAVARNRARRIVREASRVLLREAEGPWDLSLVVRPEALEQPYQERVAALAELFRRGGVEPGVTAAVQ